MLIIKTIFSVRPSSHLYRCLDCNSIIVYRGDEQPVRCCQCWQYQPDVNAMMGHISARATYYIQGE